MRRAHITRAHGRLALTHILDQRHTTDTVHVCPFRVPAQKDSISMTAKVVCGDALRIGVDFIRVVLPARRQSTFRKRYSRHRIAAPSAARRELNTPNRRAEHAEHLITCGSNLNYERTASCVRSEATFPNRRLETTLAAPGIRIGPRHNSPCAIVLGALCNAVAGPRARVDGCCEQDAAVGIECIFFACTANWLLIDMTCRFNAPVRLLLPLLRPYLSSSARV